MNAEYIYKICTRKEWEGVPKGGAYNGNQRDKEDGYIHLSLAHQVSRILHKYYAGQSSLIILKVPVETLKEKIRWEPNSKGEFFPHLYGGFSKIDVEEVIEVSNNEIDLSMLG